ncbi:TPA: hypothetical protein ACJMKL_000102 [Bacillus luti]
MLENLEERLLLHELTVDVPSGKRSFFIYKGDMSQAKATVFFVIAHGLSLDESGELYEAFDNEFSLSTSKEKKLLSLSSGGWIGIINQKQQNKTFLILHTNKKEGTRYSLDLLEEYIKGCFLALTLLEYKGFELKDVCLPVIGRKGIETEHHLVAINMMIQYATNWLRDTSCCEKLSYFLYVQQDNDVWMNSLEKALKGTNIAPDFDEIIRNLRKKIVSEINNISVKNDFYTSALNGIKQELEKREDSSRNVAVLCKSLIIEINKDICRIAGMPVSSFRKNIIEIKRNKVVEEWMINHFIILYEYNEDGRDNTPLYGPKTLEKDDIAIMYFTLLRVIKFLNKMLPKRMNVE